ncbi:MAG: undecaprenyldiphospho-muramoylpentapeptide beta-N-acetylglucosaminyltransferase [Gemmatimonadota bacterium]
MHETRSDPVVVFSGGGTGGHLYPALALADAVAELRPDVRPVFVGASRGVEARILPQRGDPYVLLPIRGFQRGKGWENRGVPLALARSVGRVAAAFHRWRPEAVVVTGGYAGAPAGLMAGLMGIPLVLQEQNSVPGVTTRLLARWARRVHVAFPEAVGHLPPPSRPRTYVTGNPVRPAPALDMAEARERFGLPAEGTVLLIVGGSQGSLALNRVMEDTVRKVAKGTLERPGDLHLLWATGPAHFPSVRAHLEEAGAPAWVRAVPYIHEMPAALAAADVALSRAGAMATAELLVSGLPAILVPLPTAAAGHQLENARALASAGAAVVLEEALLSPAALWREVRRLVLDAELRRKMVAAALKRGDPQAAVKIAEDIVSLLPPPGRTA